MNYQFMGSGPSLARYDLLQYISEQSSLPVWFIPMLTQPREKNRDKNAVNYRLGTTNKGLYELMKRMNYKEDLPIKEISKYFRSQGMDIRLITAKMNRKAGHYGIGCLNDFSHEQREPYFEGVIALISSTIPQLIFLEPDNGIAPPGKLLRPSTGHLFLLTSEIKSLADHITAGSIIMLGQSMDKHLFSREQHIKALKEELQCHVTFLVDEVIQSGVFFITKTEKVHISIVRALKRYLNMHLFLKNTDRIILGYNKRASVKLLSMDDIYEIKS